MSTARLHSTVLRPRDRAQDRQTTKCLTYPLLIWGETTALDAAVGGTVWLRRCDGVASIYAISNGDGDDEV